MTNFCGSNYLLHMSLVEVSDHSHRLIRTMRVADPRLRVDDMSDIWGEELLSLERENSSDFVNLWSRLRVATYQQTPLPWIKLVRSLRR